MVPGPHGAAPIGGGRLRRGLLPLWLLALQSALQLPRPEALSSRAARARRGGGFLGPANSTQAFSGFVAKEAYPGDYWGSRNETCVVYSDEYQFIWIKLRRTGGTSVLKALKGSLCGVSAPEFENPKLETATEVLNFCPNKTVLNHNQHFPPSYQCSQTPPSREKWEKYFVFTFVRNPFDRWDSLVRFCQLGNFCTTCVTERHGSCPPNHMLDETGWVMSPTNKSYVDYVGHTETLTPDLRTVLREIDRRQVARTGQGIQWTNKTDLTSTWTNGAVGAPDEYCSCPHCIAAVEAAYPRDVEDLGYAAPTCAPAA